MTIKTRSKNGVSRKRKCKPKGTPKRNKAICMLVYTFCIAQSTAAVSDYYAGYEKAAVYAQAQYDYTMLCLDDAGCPKPGGGYSDKFRADMTALVAKVMKEDM